MTTETKDDEAIIAAAKNEQEHEKERSKDIKTRAKLKVVEEELEVVKLRSLNDQKELSQKLESAQSERQALQKKFIDAELKAHAVSAGIKDLDFIKLMDTSSLQVNEKGEIEGLEKVVKDFKAVKPALFGEDKKISSSKNHEVPGNSAKKQARSAFDIPDDEWTRNKRRYMSGSFDI